MATNYVLGMNAKIFRSATLLTGTGVTPASATWVEMGNAKDVSLNLEKGEADITTRANDGWRATVGTLKEASIEFEMVWQPGDPGFDELKDAFLEDKEIALAVMDGIVTGVGSDGNQGLAANFNITNFSRNEPLEEALTVSVTAKPSSQIEWYEVDE